MSSFVNANISTSNNEPNLREIYIYCILCKNEVMWTSENICNECKNNDITMLNQNLQLNNENPIRKRKQIVKPIINNRWIADVKSEVTFRLFAVNSHGFGYDIEKKIYHLIKKTKSL